MRLVVIGGGAAGFFCAVTAARMNPALEVVIVEKTGKLLSKVRISGGGRCNVTHACFSIPEIIKKYPRGEHFVKKTFHRFFTEDTIAWFKERGVLLKTEEDGRMFPVTDSSETVINCLMREAEKFGVVIRMNRDVKNIITDSERWNLEYADGETEKADSVCVACGGYPKDPMFDWLKRTGHSVQSPVPSLFTFNMPGNSITALMGISAVVRIRIQGTKLEERGPALITHWGLSGPAVLRLSARGAKDLARMNYSCTAIVNWCPELNEEQAREKLHENRASAPAQRVIGRNGFGIPARLWEHLCRESGVSDAIRWSDLPAASLNKLVRNISAQELKVEGKTTYKEEFVTAGGITLSEINPQTMESRVVKGLYFAGEVLDVDGITGGFNFQHAWTSGWIAGMSVAESSGRAAKENI
jgi:predicted Rossmann fold flavoprotein